MRLPRRADIPFLLGTVALAGWFLLLRPTWLGGPASYLTVTGISMEPTLQSGDLVIARQADTYAPGEIVAFRVPAGEPGAGDLVIHRIVGGSANDGFITQGDNKPRPDPWRPTGNDVVGSPWFVIPGAGPVMQWLRTPAVFAAIAAGIVVFVIMSSGWTGEVNLPIRRPTRRPAGRPVGLCGSRVTVTPAVDRYRWTRERGLAICGAVARTAPHPDAAIAPGSARVAAAHPEAKTVAVPARSFAALGRIVVAGAAGIGTVGR